MSNKEAFGIVLKMAKDRDMTGYDIMYDGQEAEVEREREALDHVENYILDLEQDDVLKWMNKLGLDSDFKKKED
tara:strand:+ start:149 stop:370 length:222 start_codon:yes stop_codon:yes gene_type:complete